VNAAYAGRVVVGIGEFAVCERANGSIITHALGSCVAVCLWDPVVKVAALVHVLLPDSRINPERAQAQPGAFADTGIPLLFRTAYEFGVQKARCRVRLVGGAAVTGGSDVGVGKRNVLAARQLLWRAGVLVEGEAVGGTDARTVSISVDDGRVQITNGRVLVQEL
jgi:chemotaxis protein CheD